MCVFLISPVPIAEPLTSELIDTPVFYNLAPRPIKYRVSVPIPISHWTTNSANFGHASHTNGKQGTAALFASQKPGCLQWFQTQPSSSRGSPCIARTERKSSQGKQRWGRLFLYLQSVSTPTKKRGLTAMFDQPCQRGHLPLNPETLTIENKPVTISGDPSKPPNDNIKTKLKRNSTTTTLEACFRASTTSQVLKGINQLLQGCVLSPLLYSLYTHDCTDTQL